MDAYLGEIRLFGFGFAPPGWATCDGQLLRINEFTALFSLLGTAYGGDGKTTFGLPDFRDRAPLHAGPDNPPGQMGGGEKVQAGTGATTTATLTATFCIAIRGVGPPRQ